MDGRGQTFESKVGGMSLGLCHHFSSLGHTPNY